MSAPLPTRPDDLPAPRAHGLGSWPWTKVRPLGPNAVVCGPATPEDAPRIEALLREAAPDTIPVDAARIVERIEDYLVLRHPLFGAVAATAVHDLDRARCELRSVVVAPEWTRRGLASRLLTAAIERAERRGRALTCVTLSPEYFRRFGFVEVPLSWLPPKPGRPAVVDGRRRVAMLHTIAARSVG